MIPIISNSGASNPQDRWGGPTTRLCRLNTWYRFSLEKIVQFQKYTSDYSTIDVVSSEWLRDFDYNYSTEELRSQVNNVHSTFSEAGDEVWIMMVQIMMDHMVFM